MNETDGAIDQQQLMADIYEEVDRRRRSGELPADLESELDAAFARLAPPSAVAGDLGSMIERARAASFIGVDVPTESARPGVGQVKRALRPAMSWYLRFVAGEISAFNDIVVRSLDEIDDRLGGLEDAIPDPARQRVEVPPPPDEAFARAWELVTPSDHPVVVVGARPDIPVDRLAGGHVIEPHHRNLVESLRAGIDVRPGEPLEHLRALPAGSVGAVVIGGWFDRVDRATRHHSIAAARTALAQEGQMVIVGSTPAAWAQAVGVVGADLLDAPFHGETWEVLLRSSGFSSASIDGDTARTWQVISARLP
ncbi:MAG: hypothetical protein GY745_09975 [Actinomycetia bacterium]|nr:hypothetical protein [Actinomycetes bacterium]